MQLKKHSGRKLILNESNHKSLGGKEGGQEENGEINEVPITQAPLGKAHLGIVSH